MEREEYLRIDPFIFEDVTCRQSVTLSASKLAEAITIMADDAALVASTLANQYKTSSRRIPFLGLDEKVRLMSQLEHAQRYGHLAANMEYLRVTRLPFLADEKEIEVFVDETAYDSFLRLIRGGPYSLDVMSYGKGWFETMSEAIDEGIPRAKIHKAATAFSSAPSSAAFLKPSLTDDFKKQDVYDILRLSSFGTQMLQQVGAFTYDPRFIDLSAYNFVAHDQGRNPAMALCSPSSIWVDAALETVKSAIKLAHECAHGYQWHEHHNLKKYTAQSFEGFSNNHHQFGSLHEAHAISFEYAVASELLAFGVDANSIHQSLYALPVDTINLLRHDPVQFLDIVSQSELVRDRWKFKKTQTKKAPKKIMEEYARSMRPLCARWEDLPQPEPVSLFEMKMIETHHSFR